MNKTKSASSYTNKWLNRNKKFWFEKISDGSKLIVLKKADAPKIVVNRIIEINKSRMKYNPFNILAVGLRKMAKKKTSIKDV